MRPIMGLFSVPLRLPSITFSLLTVQTFFSRSHGWLTCVRKHKSSIFSSLCRCHETQLQLEQQECLRSDDTPCRPVITHTINSYWIPSQNKTKSMLQFFNVEKPLHMTHLRKLFDNMCPCEMDPVNIVEDTEQTRSCPQMDRRTGGQRETSIPLFQFVLPLTSTPILMAKNDALIYIYIYTYIYIHIYFCILHYEPGTRMLKHTPLDSSRCQSRIATVYAW